MIHFIFRSRKYVNMHTRNTTHWILFFLLACNYCASRENQNNPWDLACRSQTGKEDDHKSSKRGRHFHHALNLAQHARIGATNVYASSNLVNNPAACAAWQEINYWLAALHLARLLAPNSP